MSTGIFWRRNPDGPGSLAMMNYCQFCETDFLTPRVFKEHWAECPANPAVDA